jgi:ABC-type sugar transport system ATPase subunit
VRAGEIVGMAGLVGAGRSETARMIAGIDAKDSGRVYVDGHLVDIGSPSEAIAAGVALLPEDRKQQGLVLPLSVKTNLSLATLPHFTRFGIIAQRKRDVMAQRFVQDLRIRTPSLDFRVRNLSGGNQQKVVLGKWLGSQPRVLIFDEPTRGIDVGAKVEVYQEMNALIARGVGILLISSELPEVLGMSDRVLVMYDGRLVADLPATEATPERVIALASGEETVQLASVSND